MSMSVTVGADDIAREIRNDPDFLMEILMELHREFDGDAQDIGDTFASYPLEENKRAHAFAVPFMAALGYSVEATNG